MTMGESTHKVTLKDGVLLFQSLGHTPTTKIEPKMDVQIGGLPHQVGVGAPRGASGGGDVACFQHLVKFLIYGTKSGSVMYMYLDESAGPLVSSEYKHTDGGIKRLWPNRAGTRTLFEDDEGHIYLYNPLGSHDHQVIPLPLNTGVVDTVLWDTGDPHLFVLAAKDQVFIYNYSSLTIHGPKVTSLQSFSVPIGSRLVALQNGFLKFKGENGGLESITLPTHSSLKVNCKKELRRRFDQHVTLSRMKEAIEDAKLLKCAQAWTLLIDKAIQEMELEIAIQACQVSGNISLLMSLNQVKNIEEIHLLAGHLLVLLGQFDEAQESFLKSTNPQAAIIMRRDLEQWDQAMMLARELKSPLEKELLKDCAHALEVNGDYRQALSYYEQRLRSNPTDPAERQFCHAGVARTSIRLGDIWKGKQFAKECNNSLLRDQCAKILEELNLQQDAAEMYELDGQLEKAVNIYISTGNHSKTVSLLEKIGSLKFYIVYAKSLETEKKYSEAATAYEAGEDYENAVRLYLGPLKTPSEAFALVKKTRSIEGACIAYKYCKNMGDYENAIEFLIIQKRTQEARELAQQQDKMDVYTEGVADVASEEECLKLARYYEAIGNSEKAAKMFERCDDFKQALRLYLSWGSPAAIEQAIVLVGRVRDDALTSTLLEFLAKDMESLEKRPEYLFKLHKVLGNYDEATKAGRLTAQHEQELGNYKVAHQHLFELCKMLHNQHKNLPYELFKQLTLLHSYTLVKTLIKLNDHRSSARMLIRVARHISSFPAHVIPILIATVIECQRSGLQRTAFEYAAMLMRPEYRNQITGTYKRKIENIVRRPERVEEEESLTPCPFCQEQIPETQLECSSCKNYLPFCIASGRHMERGNWTECPSCKFPALMTEFLKIIGAEGVCPMCWDEVAVTDIVAITDLTGDLRLGGVPYEMPSFTPTSQRPDDAEGKISK